MTPVNWLPELVLFQNYGGNWDRYVSALYGFYSRDFIANKPNFRSKAIRVKRYPQYKGKDATFWHIIQEGEIEEEKIPDMRRCERICWPKPIIEHSEDAEIKIWENVRHGEIRICIWIEEAEYLVILAKRKNYTLFWTAYPVFRDHRKRKLGNEYQKYVKKLASSQGGDAATPSTRGR